MLLEGNLTGVQHLGIFTADLAAAQAWYIDKLGFELTASPSFEMGGDRYALAFLQRDDLVLELVLPPAAARDEVRSRGHGHIDHFAIDVIDLESALEASTHAGAELDASTPDAPVTFPLWPNGVEYVFLAGPGGEKVELNERKDLNPARRDVNIGGWSHLGIPTADIEASRQFYRILGFYESLYSEVPLEEGTAYISMMEINGFMVELYQLPGIDADMIAGLQDGPIDHIALDVLDAGGAFTKLQQAGLAPLEGAPVELPLWEYGVKYFNVRGPNGEKIEFNQVNRA